MTEDVRLPRETGSEEYIVGALARYPGRAGEILSCGISAFDFVDPLLSRALECFASQFANVGSVDPVLVGREIGDPGLLALLAQRVATTAHAPDEAAKIVEARRKRQRYDELQRLAEHSLNGTTSEQIDMQLEAALEDWRREHRLGEAREKFTFGDLRKLHPALNEPVIEGLLRVGETANVISYSKIGKSWMMYGLALDLITGHPWLGKFQTYPGKVLYIDNELHKSTLAHRIAAVAKAKNIGDSDYDDDLEVVSLRGNLRSLADLSHDLEAIEPGEFQAIILDAKYRFAIAGVSENDNAAETLLYNQLDRIAAQTEAAIILVHHTSKGAQTDKRVTDVGAGAGAQSRAADCHLVLREHEQEGIVVLDAAVRSFAPVEPLALEWEFPLWQQTCDIDATQLKGRKTKQDEQQAAKDREGMDATLTALVDGPTTARQLRRATGFGEYRQKRLIDLLIAQDQIIPIQVKVGNSSHEEYQLKQ